MCSRKRLATMLVVGLAIASLLLVGFKNNLKPQQYESKGWGDCSNVSVQFMVEPEVIGHALYSLDSVEGTYTVNVSINTSDSSGGWTNPSGEYILHFNPCTKEWGSTPLVPLMLIEMSGWDNEYEKVLIEGHITSTVPLYEVQWNWR